MSQFFQIHPENPQQRLIKQAVEIINKGGVVVYPTDCAYALGCHIGDKSALERIKQIRQLSDKHNFTLVCRDLSELAIYAKVDNSVYRLLKNYTPGAYTFILKGTSEVPRRLMHAKRRTIGIRVPDNAIALALMEELGEPIMSSSLILPGETDPLTDPYDIRETLQHQVDLVIDGGYCGMEATSVINMVDDVPEVVREGAGDISGF
ncbi:L-threonylcarbamoyladenylate synthase [Motiliproteus sp. MSK22-1]|uniref:L-threonylcarbamoyladenylate synthase n=1 Tax=Motiliproteus sp. MSK22-1 TaxID=1897630 RepID=UPI00097614C5|nr:L-threonylcarbamoyladenylate synthase [Motiliproteus sp. MSK22-1]OMH30458.1 threonylcarbamoyl-AMP synthase [Motiliproteus sp. MSK22-1]